jgi:2-dehydro-3-deoxyphosphogalactonate aldolase
MDLRGALAALPLIAILRGIRPDEAEAIGAALVEAGFRIIEVPLNSPEPFRSVEILARRFGREALIGAGTVMRPEEASRVVENGGRLVVMPHCDAAVIRAAKDARALCLPGVATPTEGFAALAAGADALKLFPGEALPPSVLKAWKAVFPPSVPLLPVGGITPESMAAYVAAGAAGFGIGSALYQPGVTAPEIARRAEAFASAWRALQPSAAESR